MVVTPKPVIHADDYSPDGLKQARGWINGNFRFMGSVQDRIQVSDLAANVAGCRARDLLLRLLSQRGNSTEHESGAGHVAQEARA